jgi:hypothetical protein
MVANSWDLNILMECVYIIKQCHTLHWHDSSVRTRECSYVRHNVIALLRVGQFLFYLLIEIS